MSEMSASDQWQCTPAERANAAYDKVQAWATGGAVAQGVSGIFGYPINLIVDGATILAYSHLWNDIRSIYGKGAITPEAAKAYIQPNWSFLAQDLMFDKVVGSLPLIGVPFNAAFGHAFTWRIGAWFSMLATLGGEINSHESLSRSSINLVSELFPANAATYKLESPRREQFCEVVLALDGLPVVEAEDRVRLALNVLRGV